MGWCFPRGGHRRGGRGRGSRAALDPPRAGARALDPPVGRRAREGFVDAVGNIFDGAGNFISNITGGDSSARQGGLGSEGGLGGMSVYSSGDVSGRGDYTEGRSSGMGVGREMDTSR